jgi:signal transduction histidine kinase/putative methionine-R-sulfoxide reductase with GAF domain
MVTRDIIFDDQLAAACKLTNSRLAVWLVHRDGSWFGHTQAGLRKNQQQFLHAILQDPAIITWLAGALTSGRMRWHVLNNEQSRILCNRFYVFPNTQTRQLLLVGANVLDKNAQSIFRLLVTRPPTPTPISFGSDPLQSTDKVPRGESTYKETLPSLHQLEQETGLSSGLALDSILDHVVKTIRCDAAYLAIRRGDVFRIQATWKCHVGVLGLDFQLSEAPVLNEVLENRQGYIINSASPSKLNGLPLVTIAPEQTWMGIPIIIGQRVIGIFSFISNHDISYSQEDLNDVQVQAHRVAHLVENALLFDEATHYLEQLALLNELATTASSGIDIDEVSRRVMQQLRRVFNTDWAAIFLLSSDQKSLREYGGKLDNGSPWIISVQNTLVGLAVTSGLPMRVNELRQQKTKFNHEATIPLAPGIQSELAVPLKYRGQIIGALSLMSGKLNAFSNQDEQLMVLIASHLAGVFENMRLNRETQDRAIKLQETVRQLQAIRQTALDITADLDPTTLLRRIVQRARDLIGARGAELGLVEFSQLTHQMEIRTIVSETPWEYFEEGQTPVFPSLALQIASSNKPALFPNFKSSNNLSPSRVRSLKVAAGVPLMLRGVVIGTLIVMDDRPEKTFVDEDILLLELLAPQAAISIRNARLYQELQERIQAQLIAEQQLIQSEKLAIAGRLMASIAHEINNPLQAVHNCLHLAAREELSQDSQKSYLQLAQDEMVRLMQIVQKMLDYYRPGGLDRKPVNIHDLLQKTITLSQKQLEDSGIRINLQLADNIPSVLAVGDQILQVFLNLIINANQAMPTGGNLWIESKVIHVKGQNPQIEIYFTDSGPGIPPEQRSQLFEPFVSDKENGLGLGLAVSYGILAAHEGNLDYISDRQTGACFRVTLKAEPA